MPISPQAGDIFKRPRHLAIIMDGNGRWAQQHHRSRLFGHRAGVRAAGKIAERCGKFGIEVLTLFAFSSENWRRPATEVQNLMELFARALKNGLAKLDQNQIQLRVIGNMERFSISLRNAIEQAHNLTLHNRGLKLVIAIDYSGRWDIIQAVQALVRQAKLGALQPESITQDVFAAHLSLADLPPPDLLIRTSGEYRVSNFFLWQLAYTELYFTETLWPAFDEAALDKALLFYSQRKRRFGYTSEQLAEVDAEA